MVPDDWASILALSPAAFRNSKDFRSVEPEDSSEVVPYSLTNAGLSIRLPFVRSLNSNFVFAVPQVRRFGDNPEWGADFPYSTQVCIPLESARLCRRLPYPPQPYPVHLVLADEGNDVHVLAKIRGIPRDVSSPVIDTDVDSSLPLILG